MPRQPAPSSVRQGAQRASRTPGRTTRARALPTRERQEETGRARPPVVSFQDFALDGKCIIGGRARTHAPTRAPPTAIDILGIVGHTAGVERTGKAYPLIHSKLRRSIGTDRLQQLIYVYHNRRLLQPADAAGNDRARHTNTQEHPSPGNRHYRSRCRYPHITTHVS